jgi:threonine synthase
VETSSAVTLAALPLLLRASLINPEERVICILTGAGYKEDVDVDISEGIDVAGFDPDEIVEKYAALREGTTPNP